MNVMHLNHPQTIPDPPTLCKKLSSMKLVPDSKKIGDHCEVLFLFKEYSYLPHILMGISHFTLKIPLIMNVYTYMYMCVYIHMCINILYIYII